VAQPITGAIQTSAGPGGGVSLFFGTGRYFTADDNAVTRNSPVQTLYGIWDNLSDAISSRDVLVGQSISANGAAFRDISSNAVDYSTKRGWYVDLIVDTTVEGERFFGYPTLQGGTVMFTTYVPGQSVCGTGGGVNWRYRLNMATGQPAMGGLTDEVGGDPLCGANCGAGALTRGGDVATGAPVLDTQVSTSMRKGCDPSDPKCSVDGSIDRCIVTLNTPGADTAYGQRACGRQSWRQIR
jgi:type IV pilus assembly protein PilY1